MYFLLLYGCPEIRGCLIFCLCKIVRRGRERSLYGMKQPANYHRKVKDKDTPGPFSDSKDMVMVMDKDMDMAWSSWTVLTL